MKLGFVSAVLPEYNFNQLVDFASKIEMDSLEICCWPIGKADRRYAGVTHIDVEKLNPNEVLKIKEKLEEKNIAISALGYYPNPLSSEAAVRKIAKEHIEKCIIGASKLNINLVNTFIGRDCKKSVKENMERFKVIWPDIIKFAEDNGVKIGIENCPMYFSQDEWPGGTNLAGTPAIWEDMFSTIDSKNFGLNYDPSHLVWQQMDYIEPIYDFAEKIFHFHIKDVSFYKDKFDKVGPMASPLDYHSPKLPGLGDIDWSKTMSALYDIHYKGYTAIEIEDRAFENSLDEKLNSIILSKRYIKNFMI